MKKIFFAGLVAMSACASAQIDLNKALSDVKKVVSTTGTPTSGEVAEGLKEALVKGITKGSDLVSVTDGYFKNPEIKIPFPPDVKKVEDRLRQIGLGKDVDRFILTLNRGAEDAAKEAKPIFINAIKQMTIDDAWAILKGQPDAATQFLKRTTSAQLKEKFKPIIQNSLNKVSATKYYGDIVTRYNKIPFVDKVNPDLNEYATDRALTGLFTMIAAQEKSIRENPLERTTELLKKVFGAQK
ncbi:MAG: DUF4197 domain-containing protein [Cyclobacteriaceae bacterium]|nr:DUF4197 domain-containing protein [Cyclobacteriaceae bacterium]